MAWPWILSPEGVALCVTLQCAAATSVAVSQWQWTPAERRSWIQKHRILRRSSHPAWWAVAGGVLDAVGGVTGNGGFWAMGTLAFAVLAWQVDRTVSEHLRWEARRRATEKEHWEARIPVERMQARKAELQRLELAEVQLQSLRHLMDPHFLFNALNGVMQRFLREDAAAALRHFAAFRRLAVRQQQAGRDGWWTLREEWRVLEDYIALELDRIGWPVAVDLSPLPVELEDGSVPALMVQPLVENALWHGLAGTDRTAHSPGTLSVRATRDAHRRVRIEVYNSRTTSTNSSEPSERDSPPLRRRHAGDLIRQRLRLLGAEHEGSLHLTHAPEHTLATLLLPVRETLWRTQSKEAHKVPSLDYFGLSPTES